MHLYNVAYNIRDFFSPNPVLPCNTQIFDARLLANIVDEARYLHARNGRNYWYYFIRDVKDRDVVRFLLYRNGLKPEFHNSRYAYSTRTRPAFRCAQSDILANNYASIFVRMVAASFAEMSADEIQANIDTVKSEIKSHYR